MDGPYFGGSNSKVTDKPATKNLTTEGDGEEVEADITSTISNYHIRETRGIRDRWLDEMEVHCFLRLKELPRIGGPGDTMRGGVRIGLQKSTSVFSSFNLILCTCFDRKRVERHLVFRTYKILLG